MLCSLASFAVVADSSIISVTRLVDAGRFDNAEAAIVQSLSGANLHNGERAQLEFERERMRRIRLDFKLTKVEALARVRQQIPDLKEAEFDAWDRAGLLERMTIDGETRYFNRSPSNLFRLSADARARRANQTPFNDGPLERPHAHHREVIAAAKSTAK